MLAAGLILGFDLYFFFQVVTGNSIFRTVFTAAIGALTIIWLFMITYVFPLQSRFYNPVKRTLFNAMFMSIRHFFHTLGMLAIDVALLILSYFSLYYAPQFTVLVMLFGFPLIAFINSYIFSSIFKQYMPKEEGEQDSSQLRPILEDVKLTHPSQPEESKPEE